MSESGKGPWPFAHFREWGDYYIWHPRWASMGLSAQQTPLLRNLSHPPAPLPWTCGLNRRCLLLMWLLLTVVAGLEVSSSSTRGWSFPWPLIWATLRFFEPVSVHETEEISVLALPLEVNLTLWMDIAIMWEKTDEERKASWEAKRWCLAPPSHNARLPAYPSQLCELINSHFCLSLF